MSGLISVDDALALLASHAPGQAVEDLPIADCQGLRLAGDLIARVSRPPADASAMDGYAVRLEDVREAGAALTVIGEAPAGAPYAGSIGKGEAVRIFTGGEVPGGADHIVIQEDTSRDGDTVICTESYKSAEYVRPAGLDFSEGNVLLTRDTELGAVELALAAAGNISHLPVFRRLRVGILANGNELKPPGSKLGPGEIVNSNPVGLAALIRDWGGDPVDLGTAEDTLASISAHIENADDIDISLPVGGASVGDHDLMRPAFAEAGFTPIFEKVAVRPGKPTWFSMRGNARVLGLPGNPASAFVCAHLFLKPLVTGRPHDFKRARLVSDLSSNGPREHFMRAAVRLDENGQLVAEPASNQDSSLISPFLSSGGLLRRKPNSPALGAGEHVDVLMIKSV